MTAPHPTAVPGSPRHPVLSRRSALQAGAIGLLGLGMEHLEPLRQAHAAEGAGGGRPAGLAR